jgi:hypothetical protein
VVFSRTLRRGGLIFIDFPMALGARTVLTVRTSRSPTTSVVSPRGNDITPKSDPQFLIQFLTNFWDGGGQLDFGGASDGVKMANRAFSDNPKAKIRLITS